MQLKTWLVEGILMFQKWFDVDILAFFSLGLFWLFCENWAIFYLNILVTLNLQKVVVH